MKISLKALLAGVVLLAVSRVTAATVNPDYPTNGLDDLGNFAAGTYVITATGLVDLGGGGFAIRPDGTPNSTVTAGGYGYFNPFGSSIDIPGGNLLGPGGSGIKLGALMGTLTSTPSSPADWFLIGYSHTLTLATGGHIYAAVNDTFYPNDTGSFEVTVTKADTSSVPDTTGLVTLCVTLAALGFCRHRFGRGTRA